MEKISFIFEDFKLKNELQQLIQIDPSNIKISTLLYEYNPEDIDVVIAYCADNHFPLIVYRNGRIICNFDLSIARRFHFTDSKRPIYTYLPLLNIRKISPIIRRPISNLIESKKLTFNTSEAALAHYRILPFNTNDLIKILLNRIDSYYLKNNQPIFKWPDNKKAAFISLHDVDSNGLLKRKKNDPLLSIENKYGIKGTWFFLTKNLEHKDISHLTFLKNDNHEIGWHGYNHDHRLPFGKFTRKRIEYLNQSIITSDLNCPLGMRTPKLLKTKHLFDSLATYCHLMCYDTSFLEGILPYYIFNDYGKVQILEIPTTVPSDIQLYNELTNLTKTEKYNTILNVQIGRTERLIEIGGLISIVTHPEVDISEKSELLEVYDKYLSFILSREDLWMTTAGSIYKYMKEVQLNEEY